MIQNSDKELVQTILAGDKERFREILERFKPRVLNIVSNHAPRDKVEELTQDVFVEIYKSLKNYKYRSPLENWISKISVRTCYKYWQSQERFKKHFQELKDEKHLEWLESSIKAEAQNDFEKLTNKKEAREILEICLDSLKAAERTVLTLVYLEGYSLKETAQLLGWTVVNVKVTSWRAKKETKNYN